MNPAQETMQGLAAGSAACRARLRGRVMGLWIVVATAAMLLLAPVLSAQPAEYGALFERLKPALFTVEVVDRASGNKNAQGSGFLVGENGLIATNYHVVSEFVLDPERYELKFRGGGGSSGVLEVLALDVLHDLALVRIVTDATPVPMATPFELRASPVQEGASLLALGNPYDIGISLVPGTYNGQLESQYRKMIHFTGALNPGMSGGPTVDPEGRVVGINVAGAGNSVSFLVPVADLQRLMQSVPDTAPAPGALRAGLAEAIIDHQATMIDDLVSGDWTLEPFGPLMIPREIRPWISCTGNSSEAQAEVPWQSSHSNCVLNDRIYLSRTLDTGPLEMIFGWYHSDRLNAFQFARMYEQNSFLPFNRSSDDDVTEFECREDWVRMESLDGLPFKVTHCLRAYLDYPGLYDVLFVARAQREGPEGLHLHYTLAGVGRDAAAVFHRKFLESLQWK
jgi:S1-C subfamily serine protease